MQELCTAIIPALNEEETICGVIKAVSGHPNIGEVIVVDDGSTDGTSAAVSETPARLIRLSSNRGKAGAMDAGVREAKYPVILFLDADIVGLTPKHVTDIVAPVIDGTYDMFVGINSRSSRVLDMALPFLPLIGGQRALAKTRWAAVPRRYKTRFKIEFALNYFVGRTGGRIGAVVLVGTHHTLKEKKYGFREGFTRRIRMYGDLASVLCELYIFEPFLWRNAGKRP